MIHVNYGKLLTACANPPRGAPIPAFVHRTTGDVLFVKDGDEAAALHFGALVRDLGKLRAAVAKSAEWLAVLKHNGRPIDLGAFVREWCAENGFTTAAA